MYNVLSCAGFTDGALGWVTTGACMKSRIGLVILFFIIALVRKWGGEEIGMDFSFVFALIGGMGSYLILITILGSFKIALVVGLVFALLGGYGGGTIFGGSE